MLKSATIFFSLFLSAVDVWGSQISPINTNPILFRSGRATGESPGWNHKRWLHSELQWGNFWNTEMNLSDLRTGDTYTYAVDFEQLTAVLEAGYAINEKLAISIGLPYALRFGGFLDQPLDDYHRFVGADRFRRQEFPANQERFAVQKNGENLIHSRSDEGFAPLYAKLKWWFYQNDSAHNPESNGLAASLHVRSAGFSEGKEMSLLFHGGWDLFSKSSFWITAGFTKNAPNGLLNGWPTRQWSQMYEGWLNLNLTENWDLILQVRYESPILDKQHLAFNHISVTQKSMFAERSASGWNGLTAWTGSESIGATYRLKETQRLSFYFMEDWAKGDNDGRKNFLYVNGVPDIALISQFQVFF